MLKNLLGSLLKTGPQSVDGAPASITTNDPVTVITSFHAAGFAQYGKVFVESFLRFWPVNYRLVIYAEEFLYDAPSSRVEVLDLHSEIPKLRDFKRRHSANPVASGRAGATYDYRFDAVRFANKSYVMCDAAKRCGTRFMVWLDGDTRGFMKVPHNFIAQVLRSNDFLAYLGRAGYHTETGFLPFDLHHPVAQEFFAALQAVYETDTIFTIREWHDCEAIDVCRAVLTAQGKMSARNLNRFGSPHPFINSIPGLFMDHMKGPNRKQAGSSAASDYLIAPSGRVNFGGRYAQIDPLLRKRIPADIIEVGTWSGWRAVQMSLIGLESGIEVNYKGFDVFEQFTSEFDAKEMNVKPHFSLAEVSRLLSILEDLYPKFSFDLVQGDTNETLKSESADFVFLDGGHSYETIRNDYEAVKSSAVVLFDDYYSGGIDTTGYGCNRIVESIPHELLPVKDPVQGGGFTQFAIVSS